MNSQIKYTRINTLLFHICLFAGVLLLYFPVSAQLRPPPEKPPKPISITVSVSQHLEFGTIIPNGDSGGTVTVDYSGNRSYIGTGIILPPAGSSTSPALFVVTALPGTLITIVNGPPVNLHGSKGGSILLTLGSSSSGNSFIATSANTNVYIGGTLTIGPLSANQEGFYHNDFYVTFFQN